MLDQLWKLYYSRIIILICLFVSHRVSNRAHAIVLVCCQAPPVSRFRVINANVTKSPSAEELTVTNQSRPMVNTWIK